jgi:hypothetical protein
LDPSQLHILLGHNLLDIGDRYLAAVWQRQAVLSECSHRVNNVCQLILLITIKEVASNRNCSLWVVPSGTASPKTHGHLARKY